ncbi:trypsin-like serine peptidase [Actinoallomurus sp. CA-150999]|uniref:trypsin-like serine peptidase n=1 Tax=Actinoallomurus sp. CA-150999 TaxID=3239887 RepID=UPI003D8B51C9
MGSPRLMGGVTAVAVLGTVVSGCSSATSARPQSATVTRSGPAAVQYADDDAKAAAYWTPERMKAAKPLADEAGSAAERTLSATAQPKGGAPVTLDPVLPSAAATRTTSGGVSAAGKKQATWKRGGLVAKTAGKLFGKGDGGSGFVASANVVTSKDGDVALTVAHALRTPTGKWTTNLVFVPGYKNGKAPYGKFAVRRAFVPGEYMKKDSAGKWVKDRRYDFGAIVLKPLKNRKIQSVVGGQGIAFNTPDRPTGYLFGYPANGNKGQTLQYCSGAQVTDPTGVMPHGMACDMNGGSSGGPWLKKFNVTKGSGYQISVHAAHTPKSLISYGPYFGASVLATFRAAEKA